MTETASPHPRAAWPNVWVVSEGNAGHTTQSKGLAAELCANTMKAPPVIEVRFRLPGLLRSLAAYLFQHFTALRGGIVAVCYGKIALPAGIPDIVISSGGKSVYAGRYLADRFQATYVYCGTPKPYPLHWFDLFLSHEDLPAKNRVHTDVLVNDVQPSAPLAEVTGNRIGAVLIGGRSRSHHFTASDWRELACGLNRLAEQDGWRWLVTTSRRTGVEAEQILRDNLKPRHLLDAVWWHDAPRKILRDYLTRAEAVFVSRDSLTMASEALCSGRPVVAVVPRLTKPSELIDGFYHNLESKNLLLSVTCDNLSSVTDQLSSLSPLPDSPVSFYARETRDRLLSLE